MATLYGCKFLFVPLSKSCTEKRKKKTHPKTANHKCYIFITLTWNITYLKWLTLLIIIFFWRKMFGNLYTFTSFLKLSTRLTCPLFSHFKHVGCPNKNIGGIFYFGRTPIKHKTQVFTVVTVLLNVTNKTNVLDEVHMITRLRVGVL